MSLVSSFDCPIIRPNRLTSEARRSCPAVSSTRNPQRGASISGAPGGHLVLPEWTRRYLHLPDFGMRSRGDKRKLNSPPHSPARRTLYFCVSVLPISRKYFWRRVNCCTASRLSRIKSNDNRSKPNERKNHDDRYRPPVSRASCETRKNLPCLSRCGGVEPEIPD